jgi:hypothetical protein
MQKAKKTSPFKKFKKAISNWKNSWRTLIKNYANLA